MTRTLRNAWIIYALAAVAMLAVSFLTGRRATRLTGEPHYLATRTQVLVERRVEPTGETDAALDALFEEAGEPPTIMAPRPMFVLGLADATGPAILLGGIVMAAITMVVRRRRRRAVGEPPSRLV
ncbi:MAG: hypothetical protein ACE5E1_07690 [Phycisphaerae bacterium]